MGSYISSEVSDIRGDSGPDQELNSNRKRRNTDSQSSSNPSKRSRTDETSNSNTEHTEEESITTTEVIDDPRGEEIFEFEFKRSNFLADNGILCDTLFEEINNAQKDTHHQFSRQIYDTNRTEANPNMVYSYDGRYYYQYQEIPATEDETGCYNAIDTLVIYDVETKQEIHTIFCENNCWGPDSKSIIYTTIDEKNKVWVYNLESGETTLLFYDDMPFTTVEPRVSATGNYVFLNINCLMYSLLTCEVWFASASDFKNPGAYKVIKERSGDAFYSVDSMAYDTFEMGENGVCAFSAPEIFVILTNKDDDNDRASKYSRIMTSTPSDPGNWQDLITPTKRRIRFIKPIYNYLLIGYDCGNVPKLGYYFMDGFFDSTDLTPIEFGDGYEVEASSYELTDYLSMPYCTDKILVTYEAIDQPRSLYSVTFTGNRYDRQLITTIDPFNYESKYVTIPSSNYPGTDIQMTVVYSKNFPSPFESEKTSPVLIYGYDINTDYEFDTSVCPLLDRGFVYCIVHPQAIPSQVWKSDYDRDTLEYAQRCADRIADCAYYLIDNGITDSDIMNVESRYESGALMRTLVIEYPHLFNTVIMDTEDGNSLVDFTCHCDLEHRPYPNTYIHTSYDDDSNNYLEPIDFHRILEWADTSDNSHLMEIKLAVDPNTMFSDPQYEFEKGQRMRKESRAAQLSFVLTNTTPYLNTGYLEPDGSSSIPQNESVGFDESDESSSLSDTEPYEFSD